MRDGGVLRGSHAGEPRWLRTSLAKGDTESVRFETKRCRARTAGSTEDPQAVPRGCRVWVDRAALSAPAPAGDGGRSVS